MDEKTMKQTPVKKILNPLLNKLLIWIGQDKKRIASKRSSSGLKKFLTFSIMLNMPFYGEKLMAYSEKNNSLFSDDISQDSDFFSQNAKELLEKKLNGCPLNSLCHPQMGELLKNPPSNTLFIPVVVDEKQFFQLTTKNIEKSNDDDFEVGGYFFKKTCQGSEKQIFYQGVIPIDPKQQQKHHHYKTLLSEHHFPTIKIRIFKKNKQDQWQFSHSLQGLAGEIPMALENEKTLFYLIEVDEKISALKISPDGPVSALTLTHQQRQEALKNFQDALCPQEQGKTTATEETMISPVFSRQICKEVKNFKGSNLLIQIPYLCQWH
jgi:hypothetical protein